MSSKLENIFDEGDCLSPDELQAYAERRLEGPALFRAERHLLACPLCADALEGIRAAGTTDRLSTVTASLNKSIDARTGNVRTPAQFRFRKIAAVISLFILGGAAWYYLSTVDRNEKLYSEYYAPYEPAHDTTTSVARIEDNAAAPVVLDSIPMASPPSTLEKEKGLTLSYSDKASSVYKNANPPQQIQLSDTVAGNSMLAKSLEEKPAAGIVADDVQMQSDVAVKDESKSRESTHYNEVVVTSAQRSASKKEAVAPAAATESIDMEAHKVPLDTSQLRRAPLQDAIRLYEAKDYEKAFNSAESFLKKFPKDAEALFYSGVSAMNLGEEKTATKRLENCLAYDTGTWKEEASWYLALCYIRLNEAGKAKPLLQFLASGRSIHATEAAQMLETLK